MKLNKTNIKKILSNIQFDPKKPGPLKPVFDVQNEEYYLPRAIEFINSGSDDDIRNALILLSTTLVLRQAESSSEKERDHTDKEKQPVRGLADVNR